jgi:hypothetical protein
MDLPKYDIFSGRDHHDALWIEAVLGLAAANDRMRELATHKPGPYFVFCTAQGSVVARVDTTNACDSETERAAG